MYIHVLGDAQNAHYHNALSLSHTIDTLDYARSLKYLCSHAQLVISHKHSRHTGSSSHLTHTHMHRPIPSFSAGS